MKKNVTQALVELLLQNNEGDRDLFLENETEWESGSNLIRAEKWAYIFNSNFRSNKFLL